MFAVNVSAIDWCNSSEFLSSSAFYYIIFPSFGGISLLLPNIFVSGWKVDSNSAEILGELWLQLVDFLLNGFFEELLTKES